MDDYCVCCGRYVPEGRMICEICEQEVDEMKKNNHKLNKVSVWRRFLAFLLGVTICFTFSACTPKDIKGSDNIVESEKVETANNNEDVIKIDDIVVDIKTTDGSYYSTISNVEINYYNGEISYISIDNTAILAFDVSDIYEGGVYIIQGKDFDKIKENISFAKSAIERKDLAASQNRLEEAYDLMEQYYVYDYCPT